jgi:hypothetical protein
VHPGARLSYEGTPWVSRSHQLLLGASIGGYYADPSYSLFLFLSGGYRLALPVGLFFDLHVGIGYNALTTPGSSQPTQDGGTVLTAPTVGNYFMPIGMGGLGFDFQRRMKVPISLFVRGGGYGLTGQGEPFRGSYLLDAGIAYQFGTGKPATVVSPVASPPPAEAPANLDGPGDPNRVPLIIPAAPDGAPPPTQLPACRRRRHRRPLHRRPLHCRPRSCLPTVFTPQGGFQCPVYPFPMVLGWLRLACWAVNRKWS